MTLNDDFLSRFKPPAPPVAVDQAVLAAAQSAALAGVPPFVSPEKSYDSDSRRKAGPAKSGAREPQMETIVFPCPACGTKYSVPEQHAGKTTTCKKCGATVTVPAPQVANPTIIGGTRTIRRSDIEDASSSERAAPVMKKATAPVPKPGQKRATANFGDVDMKGGDNVLRKEETVVAHPPTHSGTRPHPSRVPPPPVRGQARPVPGQGRPMQPGHGAPAKKNPMPLYLGVGGVVLVLLVVIVGIVVSRPGPGGTKDGVAQDGGSKDGKPVVLSEDDKLLQSMEMASRSLQGMQDPDLKERYIQARDKSKTNDKFKKFKELFGTELKGRALNSSSKADVLEVALMLHDDGFSVLDLVKKAHSLLQETDRYRTVVVKNADGTEKKNRVPNEKYMRVCEVLGYQEYVEPLDFDDYQRWEVAEWAPWTKKLRELKNAVGGDNFFSPAQLEEIRALENACRKAGEQLKADHAKDNFAINAREAYVRFKGANRPGMRNAMFAPADLNREGEDVGDVWGYTYWRPFIVYVEKAPGRDIEDLKRSFATKANLLMQLETWFRTNLIVPNNLQRVVPSPQPSDGPGPYVSYKPELKGKTFETMGQLAEAEGWPLEILVLKDGQTYDQFCVDQELGGPGGGQRAHYYLPLRHIVTWDDPNAEAGNEQEWFNESVLMHETFHMLSDHYGAGPIDWVFERRGGKKRWKPVEQRPRYFNLLIQEGLTDSVAGHSKSDTTAKATYKFVELNKVRIKDWKMVYEMANKNNIFRIQDLLKCLVYAQCSNVGMQRWTELKVKRQIDPDNFVALYYAAACQASYFFFTYDSGKYRDKWLAYIKADYTGAVKKDRFTADIGIKAFKEAFGIKDDAEIDKIEQELVKYTLALGEDGDEVPDNGMDEENSRPGPGGMGGYARPWAMPNREEDQVLTAA